MATDRWERAKLETAGLVAWRRRLVEAVIVGAITYVGLRKLGSSEGSADHVIAAIAALIVSFTLLPLVEFVWHYLWAPWVKLKEEVAALRVSQKTQQTKVINLRVTLRNQARSGKELLKRAAYLGQYASEAIAADRWADEVVPILAKYCSSEDAERFLDAGTDDDTFQERLKARIAVLEEIAQQAPTEKTVPKN